MRYKIVAVDTAPVTLLSLCKCPLKSSLRQVHNTGSVGKIVLLAVDAPGIYCQFKSATLLPEEDAVSKKGALAHLNSYPSALNVKYAGVT